MPDLDTLLVTFGTSVLPAFIQLVMALMALVGMFIIWDALQKLYSYANDYQRGAPGGKHDGPLTFFIRGIIGGLMTIPSVVMWRGADLFLGGGDTTETSVLAYISGDDVTTYCDNFVRAIVLTFIAVGVSALFYGFVCLDDKARGFNPQGGRSAIVFFIGGFVCIFIQDIVAVVAATTGVSVGFPELCTALG